MTKEQILEWLDKNNRGFTQKDFELFKKFYEESTKELQELYKKADENWWNAQQTIKELQEEIADLQLGLSIRAEDMEKLQEQIEKMKCCTEWQTGEPIKGREIFARNVANCNLLATYFSGAWRNVWNGAVIDFNKITMWRYTGFKNNGEEIDCKEIKEK